MIERCKDCGANLALVGLCHNCRPRAVPQSHSLVSRRPSGPTHGGPTHAKPTKSELRKAQTYRWRKRNLDRHRKHHAAYMRTWRASQSNRPGARDQSKQSRPKRAASAAFR